MNEGYCVVCGRALLFFAVAWNINNWTLDSKIVYKIEQLKEYNETLEYHNCSDGTYIMGEGDYDVIKKDNITCVKVYENITHEFWMASTENDFQKFKESEYCMDGIRSGECRRTPDCCIASTYGLRYMNNPIKTLKAYCVVDHEDKDMYICGEYNVYVDTLRNLNKNQRVWFK